MVYFPKNTNKKTPRLLPDLQKTECLPSYYSCLQKIYHNKKKKLGFIFLLKLCTMWELPCIGNTEARLSQGGTLNTQMGSPRK